MTNKEIANTFQYLGHIMELHEENKFKIRSYQNAYITLRKLDRPLSEMSDEEITAIRGVGKAISGKIRELLDTGRMETLEKYKSMTPEGVQEMLNIKGFGPKKILTIWKELGVESIGELLYAVNENRLIELKGFGKKTQDDLQQKLEYYQRSKDQFHYAALEEESVSLIRELKEKLPDARVELTGAIRRKANILHGIELLAGGAGSQERLFGDVLSMVKNEDPGMVRARTGNDIPVTVYYCELAEFGSKQFRYTAGPGFMEAFLKRFPGTDFKGLKEEQQVFSKAGLPFIEPEMREQDWAIDLALKNQLPELIRERDIKGVVHAHSTYSDGLHSLEEMAEAAKAMGYAYLGITDHSKSAFYANGLPPERVIEQMEEIDRLNSGLAPFRIFKGIESDILNDGSLDYDEDMLRRFDFIIASIHSNLRMDEEKATRRLISAAENPYTSMLGHPTGRLLLSRQAYPIDHIKVIDACAANGVSIELNANPYRLDLDWSWIPYAQEKGVMISINPDAHSREGIHHIHFGVLSARKGGLTAKGCLNALDADGFARAVKRS